MIRFHSLLGAFALALGLCAAARADEIRLADGRVLIGQARTVGDQVVIETRDGRTIRVAAGDVVRIRTDEELRDELRRLADAHGDAPHASLELARLAHRYGLEREMWDLLDDCVEAAPDDGLEERLYRFLAGLGPELVPEHRLKADVERKVRALLTKAKSTSSPAHLAAIEAVLAALQEDGTDEQLRIRARSASSWIQRETALRALLRRSERNEPFVWRTAIVDSSTKVRERAMQIARDAGHADAAAEYLAPGLMQPDGRVRIRTAEAFGELGSPAAVPAIVAAGPFAGSATLSPGATRAHVAFLNQQAYMRDFDVEVAMASFIADPQIGVLQSGVVLDVTVAAITSMRTEVVRAYRTALKRITGDDPGHDPEKWAEWMSERPELEKAAEAAKADAEDAIAKGEVPPPAPAAPAGPAGPAGPGPAGGGGNGGNGGNPDGGLGGLGTPVLPGTLPPLPGTSFPPAPPRPQPPIPPTNRGPLPRGGGRR